MNVQTSSSLPVGRAPQGLDADYQKFLNDQILNFTHRGDIPWRMIPVQLYPVVREMIQKGEPIGAIFPVIMAMQKRLNDSQPRSAVYFPPIDYTYLRSAANIHRQP